MVRKDIFEGRIYYITQWYDHDISNIFKVFVEMPTILQEFVFLVLIYLVRAFPFFTKHKRRPRHVVNVKLWRTDMTVIHSIKYPDGIIQHD